MKIKIGILGATGYTGAELLRLLLNHGGVEICWLTSEKFTGQEISDVFPHLKGFLEIKCESVRKLNEVPKADLVFSCLPHGTSMYFVNKMLDTGSQVIDFSSDFRFSDVAVYERWLSSKHKYSKYLKEAVYGLPELNKNEIVNARLVANPGCYATSVILGIAPLIEAGLISTDSVVADIKSGLSGGGRAPSLISHFPESNQGMSMDTLSGHYQKREIEQELSKLGGSSVNVTFIPHQAPLDRGILATVYSRLNKRVSMSRAREIYAKFYSKCNFVRILEEGTLPRTKNVRYSNICDIGIGFQDNVFVSAIAVDNLGKGASGQAVQNMNLMFNFYEAEGLESTAIYP